MVSLSETLQEIAKVRQGFNRISPAPGVSDDVCGRRMVSYGSSELLKGPSRVRKGMKGNIPQVIFV